MPIFEPADSETKVNINQNRVGFSYPKNLSPLRPPPRPKGGNHPLSPRPLMIGVREGDFHAFRMAAGNAKKSWNQWARDALVAAVRQQIRDHANNNRPVPQRLAEWVAQQND